MIFHSCYGYLVIGSDYKTLIQCYSLWTWWYTACGQDSVRVVRTNIYVGGSLRPKCRYPDTLVFSFFREYIDFWSHRIFGSWSSPVSSLEWSGFFRGLPVYRPFWTRPLRERSFSSDDLVCRCLCVTLLSVRGMSSSVPVVKKWLLTRSLSF